jgi:hypothetical protein
MDRRSRFLTIVLGTAIALWVAGCASSDVASYRDPTAGAGVSYDRVIAVAANLPLEQRQVAEAAMVEALAGMGKTGIPGMQVMPPTRANTPESMSSAAVESGADGVVVMWITDAETTETYVPPTVISGGSSYTTGTVSGFGSLYSLNATTTYTPSTVVGGYSVRKPRANYSAAFYDLTTGQQVWIAEVSSRGNAFASFSDLAVSAGRNTMERLREDQVL